MKLSEILQQAISLARAAYQARTSAGPEDDSPIVASGQTSTMRAQTAAEQRLREFLEAQPGPVVYMLTAIMYLGRGDFEATDLPGRYEDIGETFGGPKWAARQMLNKLLLPEYLEEGLKKLDRAALEQLDKLVGSQAGEAAMPSNAFTEHLLLLLDEADELLDAHRRLRTGRRSVCRT